MSATEVRDSIIGQKSKAFAIRVVRMAKYLQQEKCEYVLSKQVLKSGTSIGANVRESKNAESKPDFIHKLEIAFKESTRRNTGWNSCTKLTIFPKQPSTP